MLAKVVPILLLTANVRSGSENDTPRKESAQNYCDFSVPRKLYDAIDLLQCMNQLASTLKTHESSRSANQGHFSNLLYSGNEGSSRSPWTNLIASLFNADSSPTYQIPAFSNTASSQYQPSQYQQPTIGSSGYLGELNINLFDALYSISRYDDLKCVPRILCEVASGVTPGESIYYDRGSNGFGDFGKNMFLGLLTNFGFGETSSPLLNFGKAALLGYTSRGSPRNCYQEYSKCPRNPDQLLDYLNNHNGGFFRFFNKAGLGNKPYVRPSYAVQRNKEYFHHRPLISNKEKAPSPGFGKIDSDRTATGQLQLSPSILNDRWIYEHGIVPQERIRNHVNHVVFPNNVQSTISFDASTGLSKTLFSFENDRDNTLKTSSIFGHQETREEEESNELRTTDQRYESSRRSFVFPHD